jgi:tRNA (adenine22-N1)-methyltransferase
MKLTPRLQAVADFVEKGSAIADVGSDHGYLSVYLKENDMADKVIASDINQGPVNNAISTVRHCGFSSEIDVRLGGGLTPYLIDEVNSCAIAGMGGILIRDILIESKELVDTLDYMILQPQIAQDELRRWLINNGFKIEDEKVAIEGSKIYEIIKVKKGTMEMGDEINLEIGYKLLKKDDRDSIRFIENKISKYAHIKNSITKQGSENAKILLREIDEKLTKLNEVRECL